MRILLLPCIFVCLCTSAISQTTIIPFNSSYKYLDNGTNQGTAWSATSFSDALWKTGTAELGYGDGDETTIVSYGHNAKKKYITTYFRKVVSVNPAAFSKLTLGLKRDDGAIVYLNGKEVFRSNMPAGTVTYTTKASAVAADDGKTVQYADLQPSAFINGNNTIAVEVHQASRTDPDLSFDLQLQGTALAVNKPPVANAGADQSITLPANAVTLNGAASADPDGTITKYAWSKISGPSAFTITAPSSVSTTVTGLVQGSYVFRLTVTDNANATATDDVTVLVNGTSSVAVTRGPYLQMANGSGVTIRWRTSVATDAKIAVGTSFGTYNLSATSSTVSTEHEVRINGLSAGTKYYYTIGSSSQALPATASNFFNTAPAAGTSKILKIAAFGDCGRNENGFQSGTLSAYQNYVGSNPAELMLLLGDNAYNAGTDDEYTSNFFNVYSSNILKNHVVFPAPGNHDYASSSARQADHNIPYYSIFTMPAAAECGGVASGTEAFYSFNWGDIHFMSLDSYGFESGSTRLYDTLGPQAVWVKKDLAANTSKWTIAFWHHPPYTMGSHNSDTESELVKMRERFIGILERNGVDMILCGHSHDYERSYLLKGYTGNEASFSVATNAVTSSSGKYDGSSNSCPYNLAPGKVNHGTVYVVAGSAGADGTVQAGYPHNAMPFSVDDGGMLYFEVQNNRLDAKFIRRDGVIADKFTIVKDAGKTLSYSITGGQSITLTASWTGNYKWSNGAITKSITVAPTATTIYTCTDGSNCLADKYTVNVAQAMKMNERVITETGNQLQAYPIPVKRGTTLNIIGNNTAVKTMLYNDKGQVVKQLIVQNKTSLATGDLVAGTYYLRYHTQSKQVTKKIIVIE